MNRPVEGELQRAPVERPAVRWSALSLAEAVGHIYETTLLVDILAQPSGQDAIGMCGQV